MDQLLAPGLWQIDTLLGGWEGVNAVFLVEGPMPALVETGPQSNSETVIAALRGHGLGPEDLASIILTHIHLDHGGGVGELAAQFPSARVYCHPRGVRHLADPARLVAAASQVYGSRLDSLYGRMTPVDGGRLVGSEDLSRVAVGGGRELLLAHSPGHAKHHMAIQDLESGALMVGDAVGVKLPGAGPLRPATPPDDFDLQLALESLHRFAELQPSQLVLTHYGPAGDPLTTLKEAEERLRRWCEIAAGAWSEEDTPEHIETRLREQLQGEEPGEPERALAADTLNGFSSNAAGLAGWLRRGAKGSGAGSARPAAEDLDRT